MNRSNKFLLIWTLLPFQRRYFAFLFLRIKFLSLFSPILKYAAASSTDNVYFSQIGISILASIFLPFPFRLSFRNKKQPIKSETLNSKKLCELRFFNRLLKLLFHSIQRFKATYIFLFAVILSRFLKKSTISYLTNKNEILCCFLCIF